MTPAHDEAGPARRDLAVVVDFEAFYRKHFGPVLATALAATQDRRAAEDLTQDAFIAARANWARISGYDRPEAWVRRVVLNLATSRWRRLGREGRALLRLGNRRAPSPDRPVPDPELWEAVAELPRRQLQAVVLCIVEDRSVAEAAETLGCGTETIRTHLRRARARLADALSEEDP